MLTKLCRLIVRYPEAYAIVVGVAGGLLGRLAELRVNDANRIPIKGPEHTCGICQQVFWSKEDFHDAHRDAEAHRAIARDAAARAADEAQARAAGAAAPPRA